MSKRSDQEDEITGLICPNCKWILRGKKGIVGSCPSCKVLVRIGEDGEISLVTSEKEGRLALGF